MLSKDEQGSIVIVLPLLVLLIILAIHMLNVPLLVTTTDVVLKNGISLAVKSAANQFEQDDNPIINAENAHNAFKQALIANLKLNDNLKPTEFCAFADDLNYTLMICNKDSTDIYEYSCGHVQATITEPSTVFSIAENISVELPAPGVIAKVSLTPKTVLAKTEMQSNRWSAAILVKENNRWIARLHGRGG